MGLALATALTIVMVLGGCGRIEFDPDSGPMDSSVDGSADARGDSSADSAVDTGVFDGGDAGAWDPRWRQRRRVTIDSRGIMEPLVDFPLLVSLSSLSLPGVAADGADVRFVDADGSTELAYEIDTWEMDRRLIWVRVPRIDPDSNDDAIWLYFDNPDAGSAEAPGAVWEGYEAVWHLGEAGAGTAGEYADSSGNGHHGQGGSGDPGQTPRRVPGLVGDAQDYDGDDEILAADGDAFNFMVPALTIELVAFNPMAGMTQNLVSKGGYANGYRFGFNGDGTPGFQVTGERFDLDSRTVPPFGEWHYFVAEWDGTTMRLYTDGVEDPITLPRGGTIAPNTSDFLVGSGQFPMLGRLDEVRVSNRAFSAGWLEAQNRSLSGEMAFVEAAP